MMQRILFVIRAMSEAHVVIIFLRDTTRRNKTFSACGKSSFDLSPGSTGSSANHQPWAPNTDLITTM